MQNFSKRKERIVNSESTISYIVRSISAIYIKFNTYRYTNT